MPPYAFEKSIAEGELEIKDLFQYVKESAATCDAYQIEKGIRERLAKIGLAAMKGYLAVKGTGDVGDELHLEDGTVLIKEGQLRDRTLFTGFGKLSIPRTCYRIKGKPGIMPLDVEANFPKNSYSYLLQEYMDLLGIRDPFEQSSEILEKFLGIKIYSNRFEAISRTSCASYHQFYDAKPLPDQQSEGAITATSFDGKGVPVIKSEAAKIIARGGKGKKRQKKKEAIVGVSYTIDKNVRTPEQVAKNLVYPDEVREKNDDKPRAKNIRRYASLENPKEEVFHEIIKYSRDRDRQKKKPFVVIMDGALCLWMILIKVMNDMPYVGILDIIHVTEYLWKVANALYNEGTELGKKWVYDNLLLILEGQVCTVIDRLKHISENKKLKKSQLTAINDCLSYFKNHQEWMKYDEYLKAGYPIGSGVVESSCAHTVKNRMEGTGRRWSIEGAESVLLLRSVYTSRDWDEYWQFHMLLERSFNYHIALPALGIPDDFDEIGTIESKIPEAA